MINWLITWLVSILAIFFLAYAFDFYPSIQYLLDTTDTVGFLFVLFLGSGGAFFGILILNLCFKRWRLNALVSTVISSIFSVGLLIPVVYKLSELLSTT